MNTPPLSPLAERVRLGRTDVAVSRVGLGTAPLAGLFSPVSGRQAEDTLRAAWDVGISYYDTAPHYGAGLAEERLGRFLRERPREQVTVSTKVGRLLAPGATTAGEEGFFGTTGRVRVRDYSAEGVYRSLAESLERSELDAFDIALVHDPDDHYKEALSGAFPALERLRAQGAVRAIGAGMNQTRMLARFVAETDLDCVLIAGRYSLLERTAEEELLPLCAQRQVGVLVGGVFNSGILAAPRPGATFDYAPAPEPLLDHALALAHVCGEYGVPLAAAALQFPLRHPAVTAVVMGARSPKEVRVNTANASALVPDALWADLEAVQRDWQS
jgi:D-threo-aldose 1-dehydrogenase